jgi:Na+-transporting NADH:ubiquinone oxidoreductase subunit NqrA
MTWRLAQEENMKKGPGAILTLPIAGRAAQIHRRQRRYIRGRQSA